MQKHHYRAIKTLEELVVLVLCLPRDAFHGDVITDVERVREVSITYDQAADTNAIG